MLLHQISVGLEQRQYPIFIGRHGLSEKSPIADYIASDQVLVVTNHTVSQLYLKQIVDSLSKSSPDCVINVFEMQDGEEYKSFETFKQVLQQLVSLGYRRNATLIALGGGVVGDLCGFVAASYQRGVPFIQIPTTLLAMVDSSVGGKTAINLPQAKNMVGAFYQPRAVFVDVDFLTSLPAREFAAGMAEVVKYGLIEDFELFEYIEQHLPAIMARDERVLAFLIRRCCEIKAWVVEQDEQELGVRAILNLGHTFGHALENAGQYKTYLHGEAVAIGMCMVFELACQCGKITRDYLNRIKNLLVQLNLPIKAQNMECAKELISAMRHDKKNLTAKIRLIVPVSEGVVEISDEYTEAQIKSAIVACASE